MLLAIVQTVGQKAGTTQLPGKTRALYGGFYVCLSSASYVLVYTRETHEKHTRNTQETHEIRAG